MPDPDTRHECLLDSACVQAGACVHRFSELGGPAVHVSDETLVDAEVERIEARRAAERAERSRGVIEAKEEAEQAEWARKLVDKRDLLGAKLDATVKLGERVFKAKVALNRHRASVGYPNGAPALDLTVNGQAVESDEFLVLLRMAEAAQIDAKRVAVEPMIEAIDRLSDIARNMETAVDRLREISSNTDRIK